MKLPPLFTAYCLLVLSAFAVAKYQGWSLFGSTTPAAASSPSGAARSSRGSSGSHK
jgi:hypothetical protein